MVNKYLLLKSVSFSQLSSWSVKALLGVSFSYNKNYGLVPIKAFLTRNKTLIDIQDDQIYKRVTIKLYNGGVFLRDTEIGKNIGTKKQFLIKEGQFLFSKIDARNGAFGIATEAVDSAIITADFLAFDINTKLILPQFLVLITTTKHFMTQAQSASKGTTGRQRINEGEFLNTHVPLPPLDEQKQLVAGYQAKIDFAKNCEKQARELEQSIETYLYNELKIEFYLNKQESLSLLKFTNFVSLKEWSYNFLSDSNILKSDYDLIALNCLIANFMIDDNGNSLTTMTNKEPDKTFIYIGMENVDKNTGIVLNNNIVFGKEIKSATVRLPTNYFIYGKLRPYLNKYYFNQSNDTNIVVSSEFFVFKIKNKINHEYFNSVLGSFIIQEQIKDAMKGARMPRITKDIFLNLVIPTPPLNVQNRIAEHITNIKNQIKELKQLAQQNKSNAILNFEKAIFHHENH